MNMDLFSIDLSASPILADWTTYFQGAVAVAVGLVFLVVIAAFMFSRLYRKVGPEEAGGRTGGGGLRVRVGKGMWVIPLLHTCLTTVAGNHYAAGLQGRRQKS